MAGKQFLAIEVVKIDEIMNLIPNVETIKIPQQIGHLYEKRKGGRDIGMEEEKENSRLHLRFVVCTTGKMELPSTAMRKTSGKQV